MRILNRISEHVRIVVLYVLLGLTWFLLIEVVLIRFTQNPDLKMNLESYAFLFFIMATALFLYYERKRSVQRQILTEQRFRAMADFTYDWEYWLGPDGCYNYISPSCERVTGYTAQEFRKDPALIESIIHPEDKERVLQHFSREPLGEEMNSMEFRIITRSDKERWISHDCRRVSDQSDRSLGTRVTNRDITSRKHYEEQERVHIEELAQADKMITLGTLVSGVAHEINNPTNFITLNTPLLREMWVGAQPVLDSYFKERGDFYVGRFKYSVLRARMEELLDGVTEGAKRIMHIVKNLKDFSRPDPSDMNEKVDVNLAVENAIALLANPIKKKTAHFQVKYGKHLPEVIGSAQKLEQVIINLIQNAIEALPDEEKGVQVATHYDKIKGVIFLTIKDQGSGIPRELLPRIKDPFFTSKRTKGGVGLGLSIAERILKSYDAELKFSSKVNRGTTVRVILKVPR